jgi:hypothetical protein
MQAVSESAVTVGQLLVVERLPVADVARRNDVPASQDRPRCEEPMCLHSLGFLGVVLAEVLSRTSATTRSSQGVLWRAD